MNTEKTGQGPVAYRLRYKSEPGMIGHYPWAYVDRKPRMAAEPGLYEVEELYTAEQLRIAVQAAQMANVGSMTGPEWMAAIKRMQERRAAEGDES